MSSNTTHNGVVSQNCPTSHLWLLAIRPYVHTESVNLKKAHKPVISSSEKYIYKTKQKKTRQKPAGHGSFWKATH